MMSLTTPCHNTEQCYVNQLSGWCLLGRGHNGHLDTSDSKTGHLSNKPPLIQTFAPVVEYGLHTRPVPFDGDIVKKYPTNFIS